MHKMDTVNNGRIPPDGGWGWMIVISHALANFIVIPSMTSFGLLYKEKFEELGMTSSEKSIIMNLNSAFGMILGLVNAPLLRRFGYRRVAAVASILFSFGMILTSSANSFIHFLITYSCITAVGISMITSSTSFALNSYFRRLRNKAVGTAMTLAGLGPIIYPQFISLLLHYYSQSGAALIIGGMSLHVLLAALLLQPIEWHMITVPVAEMQPMSEKGLKAMYSIEEEVEYASQESLNEAQKMNKYHTVTTPTPYAFITQEEKEAFTEDESAYLDSFPNSAIDVNSTDESDDDLQLYSIDHESDAQNIYGYDIIPYQSMCELNTGASAIPKVGSTSVLSGSTTQEPRRRRYSENSNNAPKQSKRWFESGSEETVHLASYSNLFTESTEKLGSKRNSIASNQYLVSVNPKEVNLNPMPTIEEKSKRKKHRRAKVVELKLKKWGLALVNIFDLHLLKDSKYVILMLGLSIAIFAEINFSLHTPFILGEMGYSTQQIAVVLSCLASADIVFRFVSPFIGDYFNQTPRIMYLYSLGLLVITRTSILFAPNYGSMIVLGVFLGIAKGVRTVYMSLVIPNYVPLARLPSASGIQMLVNGVILLVLGPILGVIRDFTGSYRKSVYLINFVTLITITLWTIDIVLTKRRSRS